jgi:hypothetical protein
MICNPAFDPAVRVSEFYLFEDFVRSRFKSSSEKIQMLPQLLSFSMIRKADEPTRAALLICWSILLGVDAQPWFKRKNMTKKSAIFFYSLVSFKKKFPSRCFIITMIINPAFGLAVRTFEFSMTVYFNPRVLESLQGKFKCNLNHCDF